VLADVMDRLLRDRPTVAGIAVPGMPVGSPALETPGRPAERYQVLAFDQVLALDRSGRTTTFNSLLRNGARNRDTGVQYER
jgi:hypothetical protein